MANLDLLNLELVFKAEILQKSKSGIHWKQKQIRHNKTT